MFARGAARVLPSRSENSRKRKMAKDNQDDLSPEQRKTSGRLPGAGLVLPLLILAIIAGYVYLLSKEPKRTKIDFKFFTDQLEARNVAEVELLSRYAIGRFKERPLLPAPEGKSDSQPQPPAQPP